MILNLRMLGSSCALMHRGLSRRLIVRTLCARLNRENVFTEEDRDRLCQKLGVPKEKVLLTIPQMRQLRNTFGPDISVGLVPTMGALHMGHLSLVDASTKESVVTISSIFVNAGQFAPHEDFSKYPRQPEDDIKTLFERGVDYIFIPSQSEMYPGSVYGDTSTSVCRTHVVPFGIDERSEGAARPGIELVETFC